MTTPVFTTDVPPDAVPTACYSWGAVLAGLAMAVAVNIVLAQAWLGVGLLLVDTESHPGTIIAGSAIAWVLSACAALFVGGWVASRVGASTDPAVALLQGVGVWATASVIGLLIAVSAAGVIVGGSAHLVGQGLTAAGNVAGSAAGGATASLTPPTIDAIRGELDGAIMRHRQTTQAPAPAAAAGATTPDSITSAPDDSRLADASRLGELLVGHFTADERRSQTDAEKAELIALIASQAGVSQPAAARALEQWDRVWANSLARWTVAKEEARQAVERTRKVTAQAACWSVIALVLGLVAALGGGALGLASRRHQAEHAQHPRSLLTA